MLKVGDKTVKAIARGDDCFIPAKKDKNGYYYSISPSKVIIKKGTVMTGDEPWGTYPSGDGEYNDAVTADTEISFYGIKVNNNEITWLPDKDALPTEKWTDRDMPKETYKFQDFQTIKQYGGQIIL